MIPAAFTVASANLPAPTEVTAASYAPIASTPAPATTTTSSAPIETTPAPSEIPAATHTSFAPIPPTPAHTKISCSLGNFFRPNRTNPSSYKHSRSTCERATCTDPSCTTSDKTSGPELRCNSCFFCYRSDGSWLASSESGGSNNTHDSAIGAT